MFHRGEKLQSQVSKKESRMYKNSQLPSPKWCCICTLLISVCRNHNSNSVWDFLGFLVFCLFFFCMSTSNLKLYIVWQKNSWMHLRNKSTRVHVNKCLVSFTGVPSRAFTNLQCMLRLWSLRSRLQSRFTSVAWGCPSLHHRQTNGTPAEVCTKGWDRPRNKQRSVWSIQSTQSFGKDSLNVCARKDLWPQKVQEKAQYVCVSCVTEKMWELSLWRTQHSLYVCESKM